MEGTQLLRLTSSESRSNAGSKLNCNNTPEHNLIPTSSFIQGASKQFRKEKEATTSLKKQTKERNHLCRQAHCNHVNWQLGNIEAMP